MNVPHAWLPKLLWVLLLLFGIPFPLHAQVVNDGNDLTAFRLHAASIVADTPTLEVESRAWWRSYVRFNVTNLGASQTVRLQLQIKYPDGTYRVVANTTAVSTTGDYIYYFGPGVSGTGQTTEVNAAALPARWRFNVDVTNGADATFVIDVVPAGS